MNYYSHHIGDFDRATRHLSRIERSVYRDLIDMYYDTEKPLPADIPSLCRKIIARTNEEATAVEQVLNEFFIITPVGWYHDDCEEQIAKWKARGWHPHDPENPPIRPPIDEWKKIRARIFLRDDYTCQYCGQHGGALECDHKNPVWLGGTHEDENLTTACKPCNRKKSGMPFSDWMAGLVATKTKEHF